MSNFHSVDGQLVLAFPFYHNTFEGVADEQSVSNEEVNLIRMGAADGTVTIHFESVQAKTFKLKAGEVASVGEEVIAITSSEEVQIS